MGVDGSLFQVKFKKYLNERAVLFFLKKKSYNFELINTKYI